MHLAAGALGLFALWALRASRRARSVDLRGRVVMITGGGRGLGFAIARECARRGARIALCARDAGEMRDAQRALREQGAQVFTEVCDAADAQQVAAFVEQAQASLGPIDVLINNAGQCYVGPAVSLSARDVEDAMRNIFWLQVQPTLAVLGGMRARGFGRIVHVSSIGGKIPVSHMSAYAAAKHALAGWSHTLSVELAKDGILVSTVTPPPLRDGAALYAHFFGEHEAEFRWFTLATSMPVLSSRTERAAHAVIDAARHGDVERTASIVSWLSARAQGLAPGAMVRIMRLIDRLLPATPVHALGSHARLGSDIAHESGMRGVQSLRTSMQRQSRRYRPAGAGRAARAW